MSEYPVFHFKSTKEKPKTFIELKFKNNIDPTIEFICNTEFDVKINDKKYVLDTKISLKCEINNEPEIKVDYNIKTEEQIDFNINDLLFIMNDFKNKVEKDIKNIENDNKLQMLEEQERKFMELEDVNERLRINEKKENEENERLRINEEKEEKERVRLEKEENERLRINEEKEEKERVRLEKEENERLRINEEKEEKERVRLEKEENERLRINEEKNIKKEVVSKINKEFDVQNIIKELENLKKDKVDIKVNNALKIQLNILEHLKLIISDKPDMVYTNLIYIITELMKYVETINTEDFDKKSLIIQSIKMFLEYQKLNSPETDLILDTVCPEIIDILLLVDKRKIVIKKKPNCFLPWCA